MIPRKTLTQKYPRRSPKKRPRSLVEQEEICYFLRVSLHCLSVVFLLDPISAALLYPWYWHYRKSQASLLPFSISFCLIALSIFFSFSPAVSCNLVPLLCYFLLALLFVYSCPPHFLFPSLLYVPMLPFLAS